MVTRKSTRPPAPARRGPTPSLAAPATFGNDASVAGARTIEIDGRRITMWLSSDELGRTWLHCRGPEGGEISADVTGWSDRLAAASDQGLAFVYRWMVRPPTGAIF